MTTADISGTAEHVQATTPLVGRPDVNRKRMARLGSAFSAPALIVVAAVTIFPIVYSVVMSLSNVNVTGSGISLNGFTWSNYSLVLENSTWHYALGFTIIYTFITVFVELVIGTLIALVLQRLTTGRGWMMALLLLPWSMITVINAELWLYIYNGVYGVADYLLNAVGLGHPNILGTNYPAIAALMIADIWKTTPFVAIIVLAGLVMLPGDLYEAAEVDGSSGWSTFWRITVPLLRPTLALAVLFRVLQAFGLFDLPYVMTNGGPGTATTSLAILGYKALFQNLDFGTGSAVAVTTALLVLIGCLLFCGPSRSRSERRDVIGNRRRTAGTGSSIASTSQGLRRAVHGGAAVLAGHHQLQGPSRPGVGAVLAEPVERRHLLPGFGQSTWLLLRPLAGRDALRHGARAGLRDDGRRALGRLPMRGKFTLMVTLLIVSLFPAIAVIAPLYTLEKDLGWLDSYQGLIIPYTAFFLPFAIWILRNYMLGIPKEMEEDQPDRRRRADTHGVVDHLADGPAGRVHGRHLHLHRGLDRVPDGAHLQHLAQDHPVGIATFGTPTEVPFGTIFAASVVAVFPIGILVFIFRKFVISGLTSGAVKG